MSSILTEIGSPHSRVFRRAYVKRRNVSTGLYESTWQEISDDIIKWGKIKREIDVSRYGQFRFNTLVMQMANDTGLYNPESSPHSLWYGHLPQQRSLVKIEAGFINQSSTSGIWTNTEFPTETRWDEAEWDSIYTWDGEATMFVGLIDGDIPLNDDNVISLNVMPLTEVFRKFECQNLTGFTSTGLTASQFMTTLRDQTDGAGSFIFRPFFNDTTSGWDIDSTSNVYPDLNTTTSKVVRDNNVWSMIEKLAEAESMVAYISRNGTFKFKTRTAGATAFEFFGPGFRDDEYPLTIKNIKSFGAKTSRYYSRVKVKFKEDDTATSFHIEQTQFQVGGANNPWYYGEKTYDIDNTLIATATTAATIAQSVFAEVSALDDEISFETSFLPGRDILEQITITYDASEPNASSLWDNNDWADTSGAADTGNELYFDDPGGDAIILSGDEFYIQSIEEDLDNLQHTFECRRT